MTNKKKLVIKNIAIPHALKVAVFAGVSTTLSLVGTNLLEVLAGFHLDPMTQAVVYGVGTVLINSALAGLAKYKDQV